MELLKTSVLRRRNKVAVTLAIYLVDDITLYLSAEGETAFDKVEFGGVFIKLATHNRALTLVAAHELFKRAIYENDTEELETFLDFLEHETETYEMIELLKETDHPGVERVYGFGRN